MHSINFARRHFCTERSSVKFIIFSYLFLFLTYSTFTITVTPNPYPRSVTFFFNFVFLLSCIIVTRAKLTFGVNLSSCNFISSCKCVFVQKYFRAILYSCNLVTSCSFVFVQFRPVPKYISQFNYFFLFMYNLDRHSMFI